ncbi:hypothetical protein BVRB_8g182510 [Beta vulgaris subsp. vulgaris]|nr:hypothetical protein BVRB_8g182510 [Beta vulgaris subsp. vulgaris]
MNRNNFAQVSQDQEPFLQAEEEPFLQDKEEPLPDTVITRNEGHEILSQTLQSTRSLANLLPTGTILTFQLLAPAFTNQGDCNHVNRVMITTLLALCTSAVFLLNFTDSFKDRCGNVSYGFATFNGLWLVDCSVALPQRLASKYRLRALDFVHGFTSVLVFTAIALSENNTVRCYYPSPSRDLQQILIALPVGIGVASSFLFVLFPTQRHGIGSSQHAN